ncbi:MAG: TIGR03668 family PPOX class F420-dependent oxidoreductase [Acidimicrobiales bacterium]
MTPAEARRRFASARVARLATVGPNGAPHLVPLTFAVEGDRIFSAVDDKPKRTRRLARLANIALDQRVCLLADGWDEDWSKLWWVRVDGAAHILDHDPEAIRLLGDRYNQYGHKPPPGPIIVVDVQRWTGWSATPSP